MSTLSSKFSPEDSAQYVPVDTSEIPLPGDDERSETSRVAVWGSPRHPRHDSSLGRNDDGKFTRHDSSYRCEEYQSESHLRESQLNARNLRLMKERVAEGNVPLRSDILDSDILIQFGRMTPTRRTFSLATVVPESESLGPEHFAHGRGLMPIICVSNSHVKEKDSIQDTSMASVESIQASSSLAPMNFLNRHNLECFSAQLRAVGHTLTSEVLQIDSLMRDPDNVPDDSVISMKAEGDTQDARGSVFTIMKSQSDLATDTLRKMGSCVDDASDATNPATPTNQYITLNKENLDDLKKQISSGCVPFREDILMDIHIAMRAAESADRVDVSQSMIVEGNPGASRAGCFGEFGGDSYGDEPTNMGVPLAYGSGEGEECSPENPLNDRETDGDIKVGNSNDLLMTGWRKAKTTHTTQEEMSNRLSIQRAVEEIRSHLQRDLVSRCDQATDFDDLLICFNEGVKKEIDEVRASLQKVVEHQCGNLAKELEALQTNFALQLQSLGEASNEKIYGILNQFNERFVQFASVTQQLSSQQERVQHQVDKAFVVEALPPGESIPAGEKIRLIVNIFIGEARVEVLLPISEKATVGMCKRELLRRIRQQGLIDDKVRYSTVVLQQNGVTLYEDDLLEDVLFPESPEADTQTKNKGDSIRLTLRTAVFSPAANIGAAAVSNAANPEKAPGGSTAHRSEALPHLGRIEDSGVPRAEQVEAITQDESAERRFLLEMKRVEWSKMLEMEKSRRVIITKAALHRIRQILLDRETYSAVETHRQLARSALDKLDIALAPGSTVEEMGIASSVAAETMRSITCTSSEGERVTLMLDAARAEQERKERTLEEIKSLCEDVTERLRIPSSQLCRAESLTQNAQRAVILAPTISQKELDTIHEDLVNFQAEVRGGN